MQKFDSNSASLELRFSENNELALLSDEARAHSFGGGSAASCQYAATSDRRRTAGSRRRLPKPLRGLLNVILAVLLVMPTAGILYLADAAIQSATHTLSEAWAAEEVEFPQGILGKRLTEVQYALASANLSYTLAAGNSNDADAIVNAITNGAGTVQYTGMGGEMVDPSDELVIFTTKISPEIIELACGYYTGRTLDYDDGHTEAEALKYGETGVAAPSIETRGGKLQLAAWVKWNTEGSFVLSSSDKSGLSQGDILWGSSDPTIAAVDPTTGELQATGAFDGEVVVTCTLLRYNPAEFGENEHLQFEMPVRITGQRGDYVEEVVIVNDQGAALGESGILLDGNDGTAEYRPYVRVRYVDGSGNVSYLVTAPYCGPECVSGPHDHVDSIDGITWSTGGSSTSQSIVSVDSFTGTVVPLPDVAGKVQLVATVLGGKDGEVSGSTWVQVTGDTSAKPAEMLTVKVVYEDYPDEVASTMVYTPQTLVSASSTGSLVKTAYSQLKADGFGGWRTVSGEGVLLRDILASVGINTTDDLYGVLCSSTDGVQDFFVPASVILQPQYYFPNFQQIDSQGFHNMNNGQLVEPMIAVSSYWAEKQNEVNYDELNGDNCFEMLLGQGSSITEGAAAHYSHYKIYEMTVVKRGAPQIRQEDVVDDGNDDYIEDQQPPAIIGGHDVPGNGPGGNGLDGSSGSNDKGQGEGYGNADGAAGDSGTSQTDRGATVSRGIGGEATSQQLNNALPETGGGASEASSLQTFADYFIAEATADSTEPVDDRWQVFEMMAKSEDDVQLEFNNPLEPYVLPACLIVALVGGLRSALAMRRQQEKPSLVEMVMGRRGAMAAGA